jgi:hypothetical protein
MLFLLAAFPLGGHARAEVISPMSAEEWVSWTERFRTRTDALATCDPVRGVPAPPPVPLKMQNYRCAEVFASQPPDSIPVFIRPDEWTDPKKLTHYWPVCSLAMSSFIRARDGETFTGSFQDAVEYSKRNDACAPKPKSLSLSTGAPAQETTEDRYASGYVAPSTAKAKQPPPMKGDEKKDWESYIRITQAAVADQCCPPTDAECLKAMSEVRLVWCDPPADLQVPNECLRGAGFHMKKEERDDIIQQPSGAWRRPPRSRNASRP